MPFPNALDIIRNEVCAWPGVTSGPHRFGGVEFVARGRELGHVHGDSTLDAMLPRAERDRLVAEGRARPHQVLPDSGWVTVPLRSADDVSQAVLILRAAYDRAVEKAMPVQG